MRRLRGQQWAHVPARLTLAISLIALLAGCVMGRPSVKSTWNEDNSRNVTFTRLLVVGVSPDYTQRCNFEYWLVRDLRSNKLTADASCNYLGKDEPLTREAVVRLVGTLHSDGVLATRMVAADWLTKEGGSRDTRSTGSYKYIASGYDTGFYGAYGLPVDYYQFKTLPSIMNTQGSGHIVTKLYETHGASLVYTIDTKVKDVESGQLGLAMITPSIADRLRRDRLIQ
jgi:hypothetical protein